MNLGCKGWKHKHTKTHCRRGHEFTKENTYTPPGMVKRCCRACRLEKVKQYHARNRADINRRKRERRTTVTKEERRRLNLQQLGWTPARWNEKLEEQKGLCDICGVVLTFEDKAGRTRACADHNHKTEMPRGILCGACNIGIGNLKDSIDLLKKAVGYLEKYS